MTYNMPPLFLSGPTLVCHYGVPWDLHPTYSLMIDGNGRNKYVHARNDDRLNVHNSDMLSILRENIDYQLILSHHAVFHYILKYAAKPETRSESYRKMLSRVLQVVHPKAPSVNVVRKILTETVASRDINAQETCHMLQKLCLSLCSRSFVSLNVSGIFFRCFSHGLGAQFQHHPSL